MITKEILNNYKANFEQQHKDAELSVLVAENNLNTAKANRDAIIGALQAVNALIEKCEKDENNSEKPLTIDGLSSTTECHTT